mgnify:CR=1 FL=1
MRSSRSSGFREFGSPRSARRGGRAARPSRCRTRARRGPCARSPGSRRRARGRCRSPRQRAASARLSSALRFQSLQARWMITSCPREIRSVPRRQARASRGPPGLSVIESTSIRGSSLSSRASASSSRAAPRRDQPRLVTISGCDHELARLLELLSQRGPSRRALDVRRAVGVEALDRLARPRTGRWRALGLASRRPARSRGRRRSSRRSSPRSGCRRARGRRGRSPARSRASTARPRSGTPLSTKRSARAQALLARVDPEGEVVQAAAGAVVRRRRRSARARRSRGSASAPASVPSSSSIRSYRR